MRYQKGDKVKIRSWADMEQEFGLNKDGFIKISSFGFMLEMRQWKVITIKKVFSHHYIIKEDEWIWTDEMIDHDATRILSIIYRLEMLKDLVNCLGHKIKIDKDIKKLKSDQPNFSNGDVNYYNNLFRKIKVAQKMETK